MRIAFGTDEVHPVTEHLVSELGRLGHELVEDVEGGEWPDVATAVGRAVSEGRAERGVVCCWTGTGVSMAANKVPGVRAALCPDAATAAGARRWNDANVLAVSIRLTSPTVASEVLEAFLSTEADPSEASNYQRLG
jgi:ribose 5-phosphate isomerase B